MAHSWVMPRWSQLVLESGVAPGQTETSGLISGWSLLSLSMTAMQPSGGCVPSSPGPHTPTKISESWLLDPVVYHKSCLFIYFYAVTPFLCSTLYNKHAELLDCCPFSSWESRRLKASFLFVCMRLSSFYFPKSSVRSNPGAMLDVAKGMF